MTTSIYTYKFSNGTMTISKGVTTKFDWHVSVELNEGFIFLDQRIFLTKRAAKNTTESLLNKYNLI